MWKVSVLYLPYLVSTAKKLQVDHDRRFENYITSHRLSLPSGPSMSGWLFVFMSRWVVSLVYAS